MPPTCNIDSRGKRARLILGLLQLTAAIAIAALRAYPKNSKPAWTLVSVLLATGLFTIFESRAGWCALRALGIKTRI
jgi:hypothetical protein